MISMTNKKNNLTKNKVKLKILILMKYLKFLYKNKKKKIIKTIIIKLKTKIRFLHKLNQIINHLINNSFTKIHN